jgi:hypothetical protein
MTDQPARVTPGEIAALLNQLAVLGPHAPLAERIIWHERKAQLLSRIAATLDTPDAYMVAAEAWHQLSQLARQADDQKEVTR